MRTLLAFRKRLILKSRGRACRGKKVLSGLVCNNQRNITKNVQFLILKYSHIKVQGRAAILVYFFYCGQCGDKVFKAHCFIDFIYVSTYFFHLALDNMSEELDSAHYPVPITHPRSEQCVTLFKWHYFEIWFGVSSRYL